MWTFLKFSINPLILGSVLLTPVVLNAAKNFPIGSKSVVSLRNMSNKISSTFFWSTSRLLWKQGKKFEVNFLLNVLLQALKTHSSSSQKLRSSQKHRRMIRLNIFVICVLNKERKRMFEVFVSLLLFDDENEKSWDRFEMKMWIFFGKLWKRLWNENFLIF